MNVCFWLVVVGVFCCFVCFLFVVLVMVLGVVLVYVDMVKICQSGVLKVVLYKGLLLFFDNVGG